MNETLAAAMLLCMHHVTAAYIAEHPIQASESTLETADRPAVSLFFEPGFKSCDKIRADYLRELHAADRRHLADYARQLGHK